MHECCLEITVDQYHHRNCFTLDFFDSFILVNFSLFFVNVFSTGVIEALNIAKQNNNLKTVKQFVLNHSNRKKLTNTIITLGKGLYFILTEKISRKIISKILKFESKLIKTFL